MKNLFCFMALVIGLFLSVVQAETPWNRAVGSQAALWSYCLEHSSRSYIGVWGGDDVVAISNANQAIWVYSSDPLKLPAKVANQSLGFGVVAGSTEQLLKYCQFYDQNYRLMFIGNANGMVTQLGDTKVVLWKDLVMRLPQTLRMSLPKGYGGGDVYLRYIDENGNLRYVYLGNGQEFDFPTAFAGATGRDARLIVRGYTEDGYSLGQVVDLESGNFLPIDEFVEDFNSIVMEGISYHEDEVVKTIPSTNSVGESPLFQLKSLGEEPIRVAVQTSEGEIPKGFFYRKIGGDGSWGEWKYEPIIYPGTIQLIRETFDFPAGTYHIDFEWNSFHSESWKDMQWWNGNGDGKG